MARDSEPVFYNIIIKGIYAPASPALGCRPEQNPPRVTVLHFEIFEYHWGIWIYSNYLTLKNCRILEVHVLGPVKLCNASTGEAIEKS